jgi:hypothetical protein
MASSQASKTHNQYTDKYIEKSSETSARPQNDSGAGEHHKNILAQKRLNA